MAVSTVLTICTFNWYMVDRKAVETDRIAVAGSGMCLFGKCGPVYM